MNIHSVKQGEEIAVNGEEGAVLRKVAAVCFKVLAQDLGGRD
jgi:hypothetical protein